MEYTLRKLYKQYENWRLCINLKKIEYMCTGNTLALTDVHIGKYPITCCRKFIYFWSLIEDDADMYARIVIGKRVQYDLLWNRIETYIQM